MTDPDRDVAVRDRATGLFLAGGGWVADGAGALVLARAEALELVRRFSCEPDGIELVDGAERRDLAVA